MDALSLDRELQRCRGPEPGLYDVILVARCAVPSHGGPPQLLDLSIGDVQEAAIHVDGNDANDGSPALSLACGRRLCW